MKNPQAGEYLTDLLYTAIQNGYYEYPEMKDILRHAIRRISDGLRYWHAMNEYRTKKVKQQVANKSLNTPPAYHNFCNKNFRHEHIVPAGVIFEYIKNSNYTDKKQIYEVLDKFCITATITKEEDKLLDSNGYKLKMPDEFYDPSSKLFEDPFARYRAVGLDKELVKGFP
jgi:hypothetical protein